MEPNTHLVQDRFLKSIQVGSEEVMLELRAVDVALPSSDLKNTWLLPQHWDEVIRTLRSVAFDHIKENSHLERSKSDESIHTIEGQLLKIAYVFKPYHTAIHYIFGRFLSNVVDPKDALLIGDSNWMERTPYDNMIVAAVAPRYNGGPRHFLSNYTSRALKCKYPSAIIFDSDDSCDSSDSKDQSEQQVSVEETNTNASIFRGSTSTSKSPESISNNISDIKNVSLNTETTLRDVGKISSNPAVESYKELHSDTFRAPRLPTFRDESTFENYRYILPSQRVISAQISKYTGKESLLVASDVSWSQNMRESYDFPQTRSKPCTQFVQNSGVDSYGDQNVSHSRDLTNLNVTSTLLGPPIQNIKLETQSRHSARRWHRNGSLSCLPSTHSMYSESNVVSRPLSNSVDYTQSSEPFVVSSRISKYTGEASLIVSNTNSQHLHQSQVVGVGVGSQSDCSPYNSLSHSNITSKSPVSSKSLVQSRRKLRLGTNKESPPTHSMSRRSSVVVLPPLSSKQSATANLQKNLDATHDMDTSIILNSPQLSKKKRTKRCNNVDLSTNRNVGEIDKDFRLKKTRTARKGKDGISSAEPSNTTDDVENDEQWQTTSSQSQITKKRKISKSTASSSCIKDSNERQKIIDVSSKKRKKHKDDTFQMSCDSNHAISSETTTTPQHQTQSKSKTSLLSNNVEQDYVKEKSKGRKNKVKVLNGKHTAYGKLLFRDGDSKKKKTNKENGVGLLREIKTSVTSETGCLPLVTSSKSLQVVNQSVSAGSLQEADLREMPSSKKFSMEGLSFHYLHKHFNKNILYLQQIYKGIRPCRRHERYRAGGEQKESLVYALATSPYSEEQMSYLLRLCLSEFCDDNNAQRKHFNYISHVLLPEICTKIFMDRFSMSHAEALKTIDTAYIRSDPDMACENSPIT